MVAGRQEGCNGKECFVLSEKPSLVGNIRRQICISAVSVFHVLLPLVQDNDKKIEALVRYLARKLCPSHLLLVTAQSLAPPLTREIIYGGYKYLGQATPMIGWAIRYFNSYSLPQKVQIMTPTPFTFHGHK